MSETISDLTDTTFTDIALDRNEEQSQSAINDPENTEMTDYKQLTASEIFKDYQIS